MASGHVATQKLKRKKQETGVWNEALGFHTNLQVQMKEASRRMATQTSRPQLKEAENQATPHYFPALVEGSKKVKSTLHADSTPSRKARPHWFQPPVEGDKKEELNAVSHASG